MQRTTSALTAAVLGAALTALTAVAQQVPPSDDAPLPGTSSAKPTPGNSTEAANTQLYGMSVTRGARYLLRNGLDYLSYQQYDRALKFLREAEARITDQKAHTQTRTTDAKARKFQVELNDAEITALKQGIEAAQRGLRRASNAEAPYALSERSRPGSGFMPAKPSTRLAARGNQTNVHNRKTNTATSSSSGLMGNDGDDEQGQPVRLASGELPALSQPSALDAEPRPATENRPPSSNTADSSGPAVLPETPSIPMVSRLPDLTEVNGAEPLVATNDQNTVKSQQVISPAQVVLKSPSLTASEAQVNGQAPATVSPPSTAPESVAGGLQAAGDQMPKLEEPAILASRDTGASTTGNSGSTAPQPSNVSPTPVLTSATSTTTSVQDQAPGLPISDGAVPTSSSALATPSLATKTPSNVPSSEPVQSVAVSTATEIKPAKTTIDLETIPSSVPAGATSQPANPGGPAHQEYSDSIPTSSPSSAPVPTPTAPAEPLVPPPTANEDLPPLPADLGRSAPDIPVTPASKPQATTAVDTPVAASPTDDSLPPLPADLGRSALSTTASAGAPASSTDVAPTPTSVTAASRTAQSGQEPSPAQTTPIGDQPGPKAVEAAGSSTLVTTDPTTAPPANSPDLAATPNTPVTELPQLPDSSVNSSPAMTAAGAPGNTASSTTNPDLESQPGAALTASAETQPDVSALPPALAGGSLVSTTDAMIPDRRTTPSSLKPELQREVERIARRQEEDMHRQTQTPTQPANPPRDTMASDLRTQTQMDISRAPSPAEARPIKAIPVPEDWVPLEPRNWAPQRKYWAAAATCHLPLYFQDPVLERYGHSVEQFVGPLGRFLTYPVDDPTQSTQRNQMIQPYFSAGLMGLQIIAWPYNLIMDPPWEAQYDLGYYRPGDNIPTDIYWLPLHGYGPPLRGSNY